LGALVVFLISKLSHMPSFFLKQAGFPLRTIKDYEIEPDVGSGRNPFAEDSDRPVGTYTINFTPRGDQGLPNELALCPVDMPASKCRDITAVILMRIYTSGERHSRASRKETTGRRFRAAIWELMMRHHLLHIYATTTTNIKTKNRPRQAGGQLQDGPAPQQAEPAPLRVRTCVCVCVCGWTHAESRCCHVLRC
jgi:hypothetical protein